MRAFLILLASCFCACGQNFAVLQAKDDASAPAGIPANWPTRVQPIGTAVSLPAPYAPPWQWMTGAELSALKSSLEEAKELWNQVHGTRDQRKQRVGEILQERIESGQWEPNRLRLHALESELFRKLMQAFRLNSELLLLVTKAIAPTAATNNLSAPERARVVALRPQLSFAQAPDLTQADRDRVIAITTELQKIETIWRQAQALRANIETNSAYVDPGSLPTITIGE